MSLFSRIIAGQIPGEFVFRSERWVSFLDIRPTNPGHALLVPVYEAQFLADLPGATVAELGLHLQRLTLAVKRVTGAPAVNVVLNDGPQAGQEVPHVHFHVVPRWPGDQAGYRFRPQPGVELATMHLTDLQRRLAETYGHKDHARGTAGTFMYLMEEVGELAEALREPDKHDLEGEFADCVAWLTSLANVAGVDLAAVVERKYGAGCTRCGRTPCTCETKP
jgi:diadenosine tetraphosphate (Ap4A) HIT family hydrolase